MDTLKAFSSLVGNSQENLDVVVAASKVSLPLKSPSKLAAANSIKIREEEEPLLKDNPGRFVILPIQVMPLFKEGQAHD